MRKIYLISLVFVLFLLCGCSVQEKMNADMFFKRLSSQTADFDYENIEVFYEEKRCVCFIKDKYTSDFVFEFTANDIGDINKISFACNETDKAEDFVKYVKDIISVYSPDENTDEIISALTDNGKIISDYTYYETQWYYWSSFSDKNGLYFSVINKKLSEPVTVLYSLKPNDKTGF